MKVVLNYVNSDFFLELECNTLLEIDKYTSKFKDDEELLNSPKYVDKLGQFKYDNEKYLDEVGKVLINYAPYHIRNNNLLKNKKMSSDMTIDYNLKPIYKNNSNIMDMNNLINSIKTRFKDKDKVMSIYEFYKELFSKSELFLIEVGFNHNNSILYSYSLNKLLNRMLKNEDNYFFLRSLDYLLDNSFTKMDNKEYVKIN